MQAIERAFFEVVESEPWEFSVELGEGAIGELAAIQDLEVPAHNRMDLLIARNATRRSSEVLRAIARLFVSSHLPDRIQAPNGQQLEEDEGPFEILQFLEEQAAAGTLFRDDIEPEPSEAPPAPATGRRSAAHRLTHHTLTSVHIRALRAYAETTTQHDLVAECDQALGPPMDPLVWAINLRRRLAGHYNALFIDGVTHLGHWAAHAWRQVALAAGRFFHYPELPRTSAPDADHEVRVFEPVAEAQALLRDVQLDDVPHDAQKDLHRVKTAKSYDVMSLRAMGRLWSHALEWRLLKVEEELRHGPSDRS